MEREGRGAEREGRKGWKGRRGACTGTQLRGFQGEAMGAMGRDGTMEPWGHEPLRVRGMGRGKGRAEAAEKADDKV